MELSVGKGRLVWKTKHSKSKDFEYFNFLLIQFEVSFTIEKIVTLVKI